MIENRIFRTLQNTSMAALAVGAAHRSAPPVRKPPPPEPEEPRSARGQARSYNRQRMAGLPPAGRTSVRQLRRAINNGYEPPVGLYRTRHEWMGRPKAART